MINKVICPDCEKEQKCNVVWKEERATIKSKDITFIAELSQCSICGCLFETPEQLDRNLETAKGHKL